MHENERKLNESRITGFIERLKALFFEHELPITARWCKFNPIVPFDKRLNGPYHPIRVGDSWGSNWERAWFHLETTVPPEWKGKHVLAHINLGGEALVFDGQGTPYCGLSVHTIWQTHHFFRDRVTIAEKAAGNEHVDMWIEATAGQLFGLKLGNEHVDVRPVEYGTHTAVVQHLELAVFRDDIWHLFLDCTFLNDLMTALPEKSVARIRILHALINMMNVFQIDPDSVERAREILQPELKKKSSASDLTTRAVGHAHIDTAWLWPVEETIRKCARTFASQLRMIEKYPGYIFGASQAQHYMFVKEYYPGLYQQIKKAVADGRWEIQGGMWVEADCNVTGGESLIRQILHGKNFFKREFGVDVNNLWLPDVFGYSAALPQILKQCGIGYFITQKISWNRINHFPHHTFIWQGIDGSEVIAHFPPEDTYNSELRPSRLIYAQENFEEKAFLDEFLTLFGIGDGGCGPTEEIIETGLRQQDREHCPRVQFGHARHMLERLDAKRSQLERWCGELYLELHRGTLTTQAFNKRMNRRMELRMRELEILYSLLPISTYPAEKLDNMWKRILINQFHDIIPGSSITPVYEKCRQDYAELEQDAAQLQAGARQQMVRPDENTISLINTLSFPYTRPIILPNDWRGHRVIGADGAEIPVQDDDGAVVVAVTIPPLSTLTLQRGEVVPARQNDPVPDQFVLENEQIRYEFADDGTLSRIFDKTLNRELIRDGETGNVLNLYDDRPAMWDAWDIDLWYEQQLLEQARLTHREWIGQGLVRQGILQQFTIGSSAIKQRIYLPANRKMLEFHNHVEWNETHKMLRVAFAVDVRAEAASYEIQYGHVKRATHRNTSWDRAKFEVLGHRYADLSAYDYGVALLNDCKYGYKILHNVLDLNLLRSTISPDPFADQGEHDFIYSLLPHEGDLVRSNVVEAALCLNQPPICWKGTLADSVKFPIRLSSTSVILEVIKKAEHSDDVVLRLYEPYGRHTSVDVAIAVTGARLISADIMENPGEPYPVRDGSVNLQFRPFEIKTCILAF